MPLVKGSGQPEKNGDTAAIVQSALGRNRNAGRDFNAEARGKTRCALLTPIMPMLLNASADDIKAAKTLVNDLVNYVFDGE